MTELTAGRTNSLSDSLNYQGFYSCPVCRRGTISALVLTEAFGCDSCNHIFTANLSKQSVSVADSSPPLTWRWNGRQWNVSTGDRNPLSGWVWSMAIAMVLFPPTLVALGAYLFPPLPGSFLSGFPLVWTGLAFLAHLACVSWLVMEYYQFPALMWLQLGRRGRSSPMAPYRLDEPR